MYIVEPRPSPQDSIFTSIQHYIVLSNDQCLFKKNAFYKKMQKNFNYLFSYFNLFIDTLQGEKMKTISNNRSENITY